MHLKKYIGQILFNCITAAAGVLLFTSTGILANPVAGVAAIVALMALLCGGNYFFVKLAGEGKKAFQPGYMITEQTFDALNEPEDYIEVIKDLKNYYPCRQEAAKMLQQWELFKKKSETLDAISYQGGVYEVVNQDVESVMLNNMVLFMKRAAIMQSANRSEMTMHLNYIRSLTAGNDKILGDYTNLLIEASQLTGEDSGKAEIKSLNLLIESIRDYRKELESGDMR
ncbi:MAG: hypothetical protein MJ079_04005 [Ruminococcus sp.]|nr:hypothetical protein [Ruminococcus sp.]